MEKDDSAEPLDIRITLNGDADVGKTSMLMRFAENSFEEQKEDFEIKVKNLTVLDREVRLTLRDTCGQERFRELGAGMMYRGVNGVFTCFSVSDSDSFYHVPKWLAETRIYQQSEIVMVLVGCKCDISDLDRQVTKGQARAFASNNNLNLFETSAKDDIGVTEAFMWMLEEIVRRHIESERRKKGHCILQ